MNRDALTRGWSCNDREIGEPTRAQLSYVKWGLTRYWRAASYFTSQLWTTDKEQETARLARVASQPAGERTPRSHSLSQAHLGMKTIGRVL